MKRRKFVQTSLAASALPLSFASAGNSAHSNLETTKEWYEIRTYEMRFRSNQKILLDYLNHVLHPGLQKIGVNHFMIFEELGNADPKKIWTLISYPNAEVYLKAQQLASDPDYAKTALTYDALPSDKPLFNRFTSSLLLAFDGLPQMKTPIDNASLFELRTYEGYNEDAVRRKIKMFNQEEIDLFLRTDLHPVFFGEMLAGPYRPSLVYMLNFKDMAEHDASWIKFIKHPEWIAMKAKPEYANTVSNIRKTFLKPL